MTPVLNLIPDTFRRRAVLRKAVCRWGILCGIAGTVGLALCAPAWWDVRGLRARVAAAEENCSDVRRLIADGSRLKQRLTTVKERTHRYAFTKQSHLPLTLLGLFSLEARMLKGRLRIDEFNFRESAVGTTADESVQRRRIDVVVSGFARDDTAISLLIAALRNTKHFASVDLKSTARVSRQAGSGRRFQIRCVLYFTPNQEGAPA